jgi:hypothetical protein
MKLGKVLMCPFKAGAQRVTGNPPTFISSVVLLPITLRISLLRLWKDRSCHPELTHILEQNPSTWNKWHVYISFFLHFYYDIFIVRDNSMSQFWIVIHCTLDGLPCHLPPPLIPSLLHIKKLQEVSLFLCSISCKYMKSINHIPSPSSPPFTLPLPQVPPQHCTYFIVL